jgi:alanyl-tRNA synthetase
VRLTEGEVWHRVDHAPFARGDEVRGAIDWPRRLRHMQRHSGQHLLSQAFVRLDPAFETRSVGLRSPVCTIDFAGEPGLDRLAAAETLANEVAYSNLPIEAFEIDQDDLERYQLRRPPKVAGRIRLVRMGDFELSACGGTHVRSSAEVAPIKIVGRERVKGGLVRVGFRVGLEALDDYRLKHDIATTLAADFSSRVEELPTRVTALRKELSGVRRQLEAERERATGTLAEQLRADAETTRHGRLVAHQLSEGAGELLALASALIESGGVVALLAERDGDRGRLLFARSHDVDLDVRPLLSAALEAIGGRGGGRPELAQGAGRATGLDTALEQAATRLRVGVDP